MTKHPSAGNLSRHPCDPDLPWEPWEEMVARHIQEFEEQEAEKARERDALTASGYDHFHGDLVQAKK